MPTYKKHTNTEETIEITDFLNGEMLKKTKKTNTETEVYIILPVSAQTYSETPANQHLQPNATQRDEPFSKP